MKPVTDFAISDVSRLTPAAWRWAFWTCTLGVMVLALMPTVPHMPTTGWDKTNHLLAFTVLAVLGRWAYPDRMRLLLMGLLAYGGLIDVLQSFTPHRFGEWSDLLGNGLGLVLGSVLTALSRRWPSAREKS